MHKTPIASLAFLVSIISFIFRFLLMSQGPFHGDTLDLIIKAETFLSTGQLQPLNGPGYPLTVLLAAAFIAVFKLFQITDPAFSVNFMSVFFSSCAVGIYYLFISKFLNQKTALFGSLLFSFHPFVFGVSLYGKSHAPSIFFLLLGLYYLYEYHTFQHVKLLALSALSFGFMGAARLHEMVLMIPAISFLLGIPPTNGLTPIAHLKQSRSKLLFFFGLITLVIIILHLPFLLDQQAYRAHMSIYFDQNLTSKHLGPLSPFFLSALLLLTSSLSPIGMLMALAGWGFLMKKHGRHAVFLFLWSMVPLFFYGSIKTVTSRFLIISVIPLTITEGYFLSRLASAKQKIFKACSVGLFLFLIFITFGKVLPVFRFRHQHALLPDFGRWIGTVTEPEAEIILADGTNFILYYGHRAASHNPCGTVSVHKDLLPDFEKKLNRKLHNKIPVYITSSGLHSGDTTGEFSKFMHDKYHLTLIGKHLCEDYHQGSTRLKIGNEFLYRIKLKSPSP